MNPEDLISFDTLITPRNVYVLFWIGVAASVLTGLSLILIGSVGVPLGLAVLIVGPVVTRVSCELLTLVFRVVDWVGEIKIALVKQQEELAAEQSPARRREDSASSSPGEASSSDAATPSPSSHDEG